MKYNIHTLFIPRWQEMQRKPALTVGECQLSYGQLLAQVDVVRQQLIMQDLPYGARVIVLFPNGIGQIVVSFALFSLGLVAVPLTRPTGSSRLSVIVEDVSPALCITDDTALTLGDIPVWVWSLHENLRATPQPLRDKQNKVLPTDSALIMFSSGSTGKPKGVVISHQQQIYIAVDLAEALALAKGQRELLIAPASHSDGWQRILAVLYAGGHIIFQEGMLSIHHILEAIKEHHIQHLFLHPTLVHYVLKVPAEKVREALSDCLSLETGSASLLPDEVTKLNSLIPSQANLYIHYGITESPRSSMVNITSMPTKTATVGKAMNNVALSIMDESGQQAGQNTTGEIVLGGAHLAACYWNNAPLYAERVRKGCLHTGDYGQLDVDGYLTFIGRRDDQIHSAGFSFYPAEVENNLGLIPNVIAFVTLGMPDPKGIIGQEVWVCIVPENPSTWSTRDFYTHAKNCLEKYMIPRKVIIVEKIPSTPSGKPDRKKIRLSLQASIEAV